MTLIILGLLLWSAAHLFKRVAPNLREPMGDKGKGGVALLLVGSIVLMVIGYRAADTNVLWATPSWGFYLNNLAVLIAIYFMSPGPSKGALFHTMRHPMLTGFLSWALAHTLVNGDVASVVLFGWLAVWAVVEMIVINKAEPDWTPNPKGTLAKDGMFLAASVILVGIIGYIHGLVGPSPFGG